MSVLGHRWHRDGFFVPADEAAEGAAQEGDRTMALTDDLRLIAEQAQERISGVATLEELESIRVAVTGKKGSLTAAMKGMGKLAPEERPFGDLLVVLVRRDGRAETIRARDLTDASFLGGATNDPAALEVLEAFADPAEDPEPHAEAAESESHAESAESAESESHAESAETAEPESHAESAEGQRP